MRIKFLSFAHLMSEELSTVIDPVYFTILKILEVPQYLEYKVVSPKILRFVILTHCFHLK